VTSTKGALRIGTRGSQLALWQARTVAAALEARGEATEIIVIKTTGDRLSEAPLSEAGGKRLFVREIEEALLRNEIDLAVHSAKDMPVISAEGLDIAAVLPREEPWDALVLPVLAAATAADGAEADRAADAGVSRPVANANVVIAEGSIEQVLAQLGPGATVGTSSVRRVAQLRRAMPDATFAPIRGNLDTRLRKLDEGQYDVLVLAAAGLKRLGAGDRISARLPMEICMPAPGQGAIAVQTRQDDEAVRARVEAIGDRATAIALAAERALVDRLGGGCQTPIGALARPLASAPDTLDLHAIVISLDGRRLLRASAPGPAADPAALGARVGEQLLAQGASDILAEFSFEG
jgi:hydroxymethylbilane synthase